MKAKRDLRKEARLLAQRIKWFDADCAAAEHTDTGDAWTLLDEARELLAAVGRIKG